MMTGKSRLPVTATILVVSLVFLGIGALPAGLMFVLDPSGGSLGMSSEWLADSPFRTFLIPGLFLASVLGLWSLVVAFGLARQPDWRILGALTSWSNHQWSWTLALLQGVVLILWIGIQVMIIGLITWLQPAYFVFGWLIVALTLVPSVRQFYAHPTSSPEGRSGLPNAS